MRKDIFFMLVLFGMSFCCASLFGGEGSFEVDSALVKVVVESGEVTARSLKITAIEAGDFEIKLDGLDFVSLSESSFYLEAGEEKEIDVVLDSFGLDYGIYSGELVIFEGEEYLVPVVMEVESEDVLFDSSVDVSLDYVEVLAGDNVVFENKIFNLENIGSESVGVSYFVRSFDGKLVWSDEENIVVGSQLLNSKTVSFGDDLDVGNYLFGVVISYKNSVGTSSYLFEIEERVDYFGFVGENLLMWVVIVLLMGLVLFVIYYTKRRDEVLLELQREYRREVGRTARAVEKEKRVADKLKSEKKKKIALEKIERKKKKRVKVAKKIYVNRVKTVKTLRKHKRESEVNKKLKTWKKAGYNVDAIIGGKSGVGDYEKEGYQL